MKTLDREPDIADPKSVPPRAGKKYVNRETDELLEKKKKSHEVSTADVFCLEYFASEVPPIRERPRRSIFIEFMSVRE